MKNSFPTSRIRNWRSLLKTLWIDFIDTTTLHGPNHIYSTERLWRIYYIIVVVCMTLMFFGHAGFLIYQYTMFPMNTDIKYQNRAYSYPDITICPNSGSSNFLMNKSSEATRFYKITKSFWQNKQIIRQSISKATKLSYLKYFYRYSEKIGRLPHEHVLWCQLSRRSSCLKNIFITEHPAYYRCFTLRLDETEHSSVLPGRTNGIVILLHRGDPSEPLLQLNEELTYEEQASIQFSGVRSHSGFVVGFHDRGSFPNFLLTALPAAITANFGQKLHVSLDLTSYKAANMKNRPCSLTKDVDPIQLVKIDKHSSNIPGFEEKVELKKLSFAYLRQSCIAVKRQELIFNECGCFSEMYNIPYNMVKYGNLWCFDIEGRTEKIIKIDMTIKCMKRINMMTENEVLYSYVSKKSSKKFLEAFKICPLRCDRFVHLIHSVFKDRIITPISLKEFQNYFEYLQLNNLENPFLNANDSVVARDVVVLDISAVSEHINEIEEYPAFDLLSLISQIGCISGLYVGITMFTMFELFDVIIQMIMYQIIPSLKNRIQSKHKNMSETLDRIASKDTGE